MISRYPLDPLTPDEIQQACDILKKEKMLATHHKFVQVSLNEPSQSELKNKARLPHRVAFICVLDSKKNETYEANVDLTLKSVVRWDLLPFDRAPFGQAPIMQSDYEICDRVVKSNPEWRAILKRRGLTDSEIDLVQIDPFAPGYFNDPKEKGKRLARAVCYYRADLAANGYGCPIEGLYVDIDLIKQSVLRVVDDGRNTPIPKKAMNLDAASIEEKRQPSKPINITQPEGPNFEVDGWRVRWEGWTFRVGFTPREGLVLHEIAFDGRPIIFRASTTELVVPYGDPSKTRRFHAAFDGGENGFGSSANALKLGCDCVGQIHYFDVAMADEAGNAKVLKHAVCMHEEDGGNLWKHVDTRRGTSETRRDIELVISSHYTIDNYDYGDFRRFGKDGSVRSEKKLSGILQTAATYPNMKYE